MESFDESSPGSPAFLSVVKLLYDLCHNRVGAHLCTELKRLVGWASNALPEGNRQKAFIMKLHKLKVNCKSC